MKMYFELKKVVTKKSDKHGFVRAIIIERGIKVVLSTGIKIEIKDWHKGFPKQISKTANVRLFLNKYKTSFDNYIMNVKLANELPSLSSAKAYLLNDVEGVKTPFDVIDIFIRENEGLYKPNALKPYRAIQKHLNEFDHKIQFTDLNKKFRDKFVKYLSSKGLQNPTINKQLVKLKVICKYANKNRYTSSVDYLEISKIKEVKQRIITLTRSEFFSYFNFNFGQKNHLAIARDIFCFAAFTGLRYDDLFKVSSAMDKDKELRLKLIPEAVQILERYNYSLPLSISNQKLNLNIKNGAKIAGIDREENIVTQYLTNITTMIKPVHQLISVHDAIKTFVILILDGGLSILDVMRISTHNSLEAFVRYISI